MKNGEEKYYVFYADNGNSRKYLLDRMELTSFLHEGMKFTSFKKGLQLAKKTFDKKVKLGYVKVVNSFEYRKVED